MARQYQAGEEESACPGEENCETWCSSAEDSPVRCPSCPKREARDASAKEIEAFDERLLLDRVERFRQERNAGRAVYELLTPEEWEAMLIWDETIEQYKRGHQIRIEQMFRMMVALVTPQ